MGCSSVKENTNGSETVTSSTTDADYAYDSAASIATGDSKSGMDTAETPTGSIVAREPSVSEKTLPSSGESGSTTSDKNETQYAAKQLTSKAIYDIDNYAEWLALFQSNQTDKTGEFGQYESDWTNLTSSSLSSLSRLKVHMTFQTAAWRDVIVSISDDTQTQTPYYQATTDSFGNAYLYLPKNVEYPLTLKCLYPNYSYSMNLESMPENNLINIEGYEENSTVIINQVNLIDLCFVIDTTGSMSDELNYLKAEVTNVIEQVTNADDNTTVRLALLFYRDKGDTYITTKTDFSTDIASQVERLSKQFATGGGDFPEAVDQALDEAVNELSWSATASTKLLIHVLDAPPHSEKAKMERYNKAIIDAANKGIRIIPVASSGIDKWTEYLLRSEAQYTGGVYSCLTNESGIGGSHIDPSTSTPITTEYLNEMLVRLIKEYHSGQKIAPIAYNTQTAD